MPWLFCLHRKRAVLLFLKDRHGGELPVMTTNGKNGSSYVPTTAVCFDFSCFCWSDPVTDVQVNVYIRKRLSWRSFQNEYSFLCWTLKYHISIISTSYPVLKDWSLTKIQSYVVEALFLRYFKVLQPMQLVLNIHVIIRGYSGMRSWNIAS